MWRPDQSFIRQLLLEFVMKLFDEWEGVFTQITFFLWVGHNIIQFFVGLAPENVFVIFISQAELAVAALRERWKVQIYSVEDRQKRRALQGLLCFNFQ